MVETPDPADEVTDRGIVTALDGLVRAPDGLFGRPDEAGPLTSRAVVDGLLAALREDSPVWGRDDITLVAARRTS
jgi:hypothetical protein